MTVPRPRVATESPAGTNDKALIDRVRSGDVDAFAVLYRAHVGAVRRAVSDNVHAPEEVADVVQDTFARALAGLASLHDPDRFRPWLLQIARHAAIDHRRARTRMRHESDEELQNRGTPDAGPSDLAEVAELASLVRGCVDGLTRRDATVLTMVTRFGLGPSAIAAALGVTPGAAKVIVHRAKKRLRQAVALEVLVRARGPACEELAALLGTGNRAAAARHAAQCASCQADAAGEVSLYGLSVDDR
jgi:RNA polymerase sigma factor (sigma-70 family)